MTTQGTPSLPRKIILATDLSGRCDRAFDRAAGLAMQWNARLVVVHALERNANRGQEPSWRSAAYEELSIAQRQVGEDLMDRDLPFDVYMEEGEPVALVTKIALQQQCELVVTGTARNEIFGRNFLGTTVERLARHSLLPILVVKTRARRLYDKVLVATDFSDASRVALYRAAEMFPTATITLLHCYHAILGGIRENDGGYQLADTERAAFLNQIPTEMRDRLEVLVEPGPVGSMVNAFYAQNGLDLLVIGSKGRSAIAHVLLGSTAEGLLSSARCDILLVSHAHSEQPH